jgi:hypothetical protein
LRPPMLIDNSFRDPESLFVRRRHGTGNIDPLVGPGIQIAEDGDRHTAETVLLGRVGHAVDGEKGGRVTREEEPLAGLRRGDEEGVQDGEAAQVELAGKCEGHLSGADGAWAPPVHP